MGEKLQLLAFTLGENMKYYLIDGLPFALPDTWDKTNGYERADLLTKAQYDFAVANPQATKQEIKDMQLTVHVPTLEELKQAKIAEIENSATQAILAGYEDNDFNITLAIEKDDIQQFNNRLALNNLAESLGNVIGEQIITDINQNPHTLSWLNFRILLVKMGVYVNSIWENLATKKSLARACESPEALDSISW